jgi:NAD(P)-dependent dehydrogenase (short-subunit alcohol dehydrogenase family)
MTYALNGKVAVITGGGGAICGEIAANLALAGARVAVCDLSLDNAKRKVDRIVEAKGLAMAVECDVTSKASVAAAIEMVVAQYGTVDMLVNGAGGSRKECTTSAELEFFDIAPEALTSTVALNYMGAVIPSQAVGRLFAAKKSGVVLNIASIAGISPLTRAVGYSNGKAALISFTQWLAVHMAQNYASTIRVNAIAPGFMLTDQNRFLLVDEKTGAMTERAQKILAAVPMGRYGNPEEIVGAALWLLSDAASFVTGAVVPVDGGYTAFSGV